MNILGELHIPHSKFWKREAVAHAHAHTHVRCSKSNKTDAQITL